METLCLQQISDCLPVNTAKHCQRLGCLLNSLVEVNFIYLFLRIFFKFLNCAVLLEWSISTVPIRQRGINMFGSIFMELTFMGLCIVNVFLSVTNKMQRCIIFFIIVNVLTIIKSIIQRCILLVMLKNIFIEL